MKQKKGRNKWADHYTRQARKDRYPARSVYKLQEIQKKHRIIKKGDKVLDLGCAPGSWLLYAAETVGPKGHVVGIDLKPVTIALPSQAKSYTADIFSLDEKMTAAVGAGYHVVLSDMAPNTTGNKDVDAARSDQLCRQALALAETLLRPGGVFICKIFQGADFKAFVDMIKGRFKRCDIFKPQSSRKQSKEVFIIAKGIVEAKEQEYVGT